jgi:hypothetical protein
MRRLVFVLVAVVALAGVVAWPPNLYWTSLKVRSFIGRRYALLKFENRPVERAAY